MDMESVEEQAEHFIMALRNRYNLPELSFESGSCIISFDAENIMVLYPQLEDLHSIIISIPIGVIPLSGAQTSAFMLETLNGNDAWSLTCGSTLGMDKTNGAVSLWQRFVLPAQSDEEIFDAVESMLGTAEMWREILQQHGGQPAFGSAESLREEDAGMMKV